MKRKRYTEPQIVFALQQAESGTAVAEICRKMGVAEATFYRWKKHYGGLVVTEIRRLRQLEDENRRLKQLVAEPTLDKAMLQDVRRKKARTPVRRRASVEYLQTGYGVSERRACRVLISARSTQRYQSVADRHEALRLRLRELAAARPNWGYRRLTLLLRREGWPDNHKLVYRLYKEEALGLRRKLPRRRVSAARRENVPAPSRCNEIWSMDFMADQLYSGRPIRILTIVDNYSRESLALRAGFRLSGEDVAGVLNEVSGRRGVPTSIRVDNGTEFTSKAMDQWAYWKGVTLDFSRPGKPCGSRIRGTTG